MREQERAPTISFVAQGKTAAEVCRHLGDHGICAWDGHFYAVRATEVLGLLEKGGVTRMGVMLYNSEAEIQRTLESVHELMQIT